MSVNLLRVARWAATLLALALIAVPVILMVVFDVAGSKALSLGLAGGGGTYVLLAVFYVVWLPATVYGLVWALDHLGIQRTGEGRVVKAGQPRRAPAFSTRRRRRVAAGMRYLAAQEEARRAGDRAATRTQTARSAAPQATTHVRGSEAAETAPTARSDTGVCGSDARGRRG